MRTFQSFVITFTLFLSACGSGNRGQNTSSSTAVISSTTGRQDSIDKIWDSIYSHLDTLCIPCYDTEQYQVLTDGGVYHGDEVPAEAEDRHWVGFFKSPKGYYFDSTDISITYHTDIVDKDTLTKTGKLITALHTDTVILLLSASPMATKKMVTNLLIPQPFPEPDADTLHFFAQHIDYSLFASGIRRPPNTGYNEYVNYKLYLTGRKDGKKITQVIRASKYYEVDQLLFAGDIDGDGIPDMICTIQGENSSSPTLYLSKGLPENILLKVAGSWVTTGC